MEPSRQDFDQAAETFRSLRGLRGHWDGARWNEDVDKFDGAKHRAMCALQQAAASSETLTEGAVRGALGDPDHVVTHLEDLQRGEGANTGPDEERPYFLVYHWRGLHDYLHFKVGPSHHLILDCQWYHAYE